MLVIFFHVIFRCRRSCKNGSSEPYNFCLKFLFVRIYHSFREIIMHYLKWDILYFKGTTCISENGLYIFKLCIYTVDLLDNLIADCAIRAQHYWRFMKEISQQELLTKNVKLWQSAKLEKILLSELFWKHKRLLNSS